MRKMVWVILGLLLIAGCFYLYRESRKPAASPSMPKIQKERPLPPVTEPAAKEQPMPSVPENEKSVKLREETVRLPLKRQPLVRDSVPAETSLSLKNNKDREIMPGVTLKPSEKEISIRMEEATESLNIRRGASATGDQYQMLWKKKF